MAKWLHTSLEKIYWLAGLFGVHLFNILVNSFVCLHDFRHFLSLHDTVPNHATVLRYMTKSQKKKPSFRLLRLPKCVLRHYLFRSHDHAIIVSLCTNVLYNKCSCSFSFWLGYKRNLSV